MNKESKRVIFPVKDKKTGGMYEVDIPAEIFELAQAFRRACIKHNMSDNFVVCGCAFNFEEAFKSRVMRAFE